METNTGDACSQMDLTTVTMVTTLIKTYSDASLAVLDAISALLKIVQHVLKGSISQAKEQCVTLEYDVIPGDEVRFAVFAQRRLPASACWQLCDGTDCAAPPSPCDTCDWVGPKSVVPTGSEPLHTGRYVAKSAHQTLRFPREVATGYVALCDERAGLGESDSWIVQPSAWAHATTVSVPYGDQQWPAWGRVDMSRWK
jgi:hypothetical protein